MTAREHDTILAALRGFQTLLTSQGPFRSKKEVDQWIAELQVIVENDDGDSRNELATPEYIDELIGLLAIRNAGDPIRSNQHQAADLAVLDLLDTYSFIIVGDEKLAFFPATVLAKHRYGPSTVKILYHPEVADKYNLGSDEHGERTKILEENAISMIRFVGLPHPQPELESWAVFDVRKRTFVDAIENGAVPALSKEQLERRMIDLAAELTKRI